MATEFICNIDTGNGIGTDYTSLSKWITALKSSGGVNIDLTSNTNLTKCMVFSGNLFNSIPDGTILTLYRNNISQGTTCVCGHTNYNGQILCVNISNASQTYQANDEWRIDANNRFVINNMGDSVILVASCRCTTGISDTSTTIDIITGINNYIKIWTDPSEGYRHRGKWDPSKYNISMPSAISTTPPIKIISQYVRIDGLQVYVDRIALGTVYGITAVPITSITDIQISNNIVKTGSHINGGSAIELSYDLGITNMVAKVWNNIVYSDTTSAGGGGGIKVGDIDWAAYVYNNTIYNFSYGIIGAPSCHAKNNLLYKNTVNYYSYFNTDSTNNLSGPTLTDAPSLNARQAQPVTFVDEVNKDLHLDKTDIGAMNYGANLYNDPNIPFQNDIDGNNRGGAGAIWDIGADEYSSLCPPIQIIFQVI